MLALLFLEPSSCYGQSGESRTNSHFDGSLRKIPRLISAWRSRRYATSIEEIGSSNVAPNIFRNYLLRFRMGVSSPGPPFSCFYTWMSRYVLHGFHSVFTDSRSPCTASLNTSDPVGALRNPDDSFHDSNATYDVVGLPQNQTSTQISNQSMAQREWLTEVDLSEFMLNTNLDLLARF